MFWHLLLLVALPLVHAAAVPNTHDSDDHNHSHDVRQSLPNNWYQARDHPVHKLFKRAPGDGVDYAPVGTQAWSAAFPRAFPDPNAVPPEWLSALNAAVAAGKIPNIPPSTNTPQTNPVYAPGLNPNSPEICSATYKCRIPGDIWDSPNGVFASSFDDGPSTTTPTLVQFLDTNNVSTTHFMIGINILAYPSQFLSAFDSGNDIAVHTWTHPYMTTLSNIDVVGQLGWTMLLIHNSTGGRVPRYWRPPYGDSDMRVRSIAKEVFGLETVIWNQDTSDWSAPNSGVIQDSLTRFLTGPKTPGLVILEHEITPTTVTAFINSFPLINTNGWTFASLAKVINDGRSYQNALDSSSNDVKVAGILLGGSSSAVTSTSTSAVPATSSTSGHTLAPSSTSSSSASTRLRLDLQSHSILSLLFPMGLIIFFS